jgi:hypothetical protein
VLAAAVPACIQKLVADPSVPSAAMLRVALIRCLRPQQMDLLEPLIINSRRASSAMSLDSDTF